MSNNFGQILVIIKLFLKNAKFLGERLILQNNSVVNMTPSIKVYESPAETYD